MKDIPWKEIRSRSDAYKMNVREMLQQILVPNLGNGFSSCLRNSRHFSYEKQSVCRSDELVTNSIHFLVTIFSP